MTTSAATRLSDRDLDAVLALAGSLGSVVELDELRHQTISLLPALVPATSVTWNDVDLANDRMDVVTDLEVDTAGRQAYNDAFLAHVAEHPVIGYYQKTNDGRPYAISDFLTEADFHATGLYQHLYRELDLEDQLSFVLPDPFVIVGVAVNR